jgi:hypothetical protein
MPREKDTLLEKPTPRPYRYKFNIKDSSKLRKAQTHINFWFVNFGLLSCYLVCGLIIAALGMFVVLDVYVIICVFVLQVHQ